MTDEQFKELSGKLDALNENLSKTHAEEFQWAKVILGQQQNFGSRLGLDTTPREFIPYYNPLLVPSLDYPEVYNKYGERMEIFFISDREFAHAPNEKNSRYIIWDRYNYGIDTHFYTHDEIFRTVGKPKRKYAILIEPKTIKPQSYEMVLKHRNYVEKNFDLLFTYDAQILNTISNAKFVPFAANVWYGTGGGGVMFDAIKSGMSNENQFVISPENYKHKTKNISMIASAKELCHGHIVRKKLAFYCKEKGLADTFGKFDGGAYCAMELPFEHYRYSICVENDITPFYFTEKIMNAFAAQTIPIYLGATEIGRFFNPAGIIQIGLDDCEHIENILKRCTPEEYERRLPAVIDNFNRAMKYTTQTRFDDMYDMYIKDR